MFDTHDSGKWHSFFCDPGEYLWTFVGNYLHEPWLHVTYYVDGDEGLNFAKTLMLSKVSQLLDISQRESVKLKFVDIVTPGYMNGTGRWKMEPLKEIWLCGDDEFENQDKNVFVLEGGVRYSHPSASFEEGLCVDRLIFHI